MFTDASVVRRIESMRERYRMYAYTKEAFAAIVYTMLESIDIPFEEIRKLDLSLRPNKDSVDARHLLEQIDEQFAKKVCTRALKLIDKMRDRPRPR